MNVKTNIFSTTGETTVTVTRVGVESTTDERTTCSVGGEMIVTVIEGWGASANNPVIGARSNEDLDMHYHNV